ncbi:hypothetical protein CPB86DRAFT_799232 [Serendipita vermifera]|nr:hypothetical protein CPB86DRAFT_799232 [Serendipita vermifera]
MDKGYSYEPPRDPQHPALLSHMGDRMSPDDCFLTDVSHLILEAAAEETILGHTNLLSRSSAPWIWDLDRTPCFVEMFSDFTMSVWMRVDEGERQLLASATFNGQELYDAKEVELEMAMTHHEDYPDLVFKAKVIGIEDVKSLPPDLAK